MASSTFTLSDDSKCQPISQNLFSPLESDILATKSTTKSPPGEVKKTQQTNLTTKITSLHIPSDPFKTLYRNEWRAHTTSEESAIVKPSTPGPHAPSSEMSIEPSNPLKLDENIEQPTCVNGKFQNLTLHRVLALRKVQAAIQSAPNASAVGADSTSFSEDDLKCLTMEELQALQKRKRAIHKEIQPLSVVKVSIQAERSRKRLEPRDYQMELYERARRENTIAVLGTGTGKTLIACLLIKDILVQERVNRTTGIKKKICVFVVPLVHLVFQQGNVIEANTVAHTKRMCSEVYGHPKTWEQWQRLFETEDVLIMTAQIFLSALGHSLITMSQINLLIFDECHHAKRNDPYALIMREYYNQTPEDQRPRIFGMTASPVDAKMAFIEASEQLERTLHAKICTPRIKDTLSALVPRPREEKIYYKPSAATPHTELFKKISAIASRSDPRSRLKKAFRAAENALEEYGPWMSDRVWRWKLQEMEEKNEMENDPIANRRGKQNAGSEKKRKKIWETQTDIQARESKEEQEREIKRVEEILANEAHFDTKPHLTTDDLSPKVLKLIELLSQVYTTPQTSGIVFVRQRYAASAMHQLIKELELPNIACDMLVGHGMEGDIAMDHRKQVMVINQFRQGKLNLLIATSVAEEGLDIPSCNVVIRFDLCETLIEYIQSCGRARQRESRLFHMVEEGNMNHTKCYNHINLAKKMMEDYARSLYEVADYRDRVVTIEDDEYDDYDPQTDDLLQIQDEFFIEPSTGAQLSRNGAIGLLYQYCATLPGDAYSNHIPDFKIEHSGIGYVCNVTMPLNAPISLIRGEIQPSKKKAKQDAAFRACIDLRRKEALTERFFPYRVKMTHDERDPEVEGLMENNKKFSREYPCRNPAFWDLESFIPSELYVTIIWIETPDLMYHGRRHRPLCLLTRKAMPEIPPLYIHGRGESTNAVSKSLKLPVIVTEERLQTLSMFTIRLLSIAANKQFECDPASFPYWIAPVKFDLMDLVPTDSSLFEGSPDKIIAWDEVAHAAKERWQEPKIHDLATPRARQECLVYTKGEEGRRYFLREVRKDLCPLSTPPEGSRESENGKYSRIIDWYLSYRPRLSVNLDQPIWEVTLITRLFNYVRKESIDSPNFPEAKSKKPCYLIPSMCVLSTVKASVLSMAVLLPSLLTQVDAFLMAYELKDLIGVKASTSLLREAITTPSAQMVVDYERLELLGDSFLKVIATCGIFLDHPEKHEGLLHALRIKIICNKFLRARAKKLKLYEIVRSQPFVRRLWRPPGFSAIGDLDEMEEEPIVHTLGNKTLADVVEAMIGAALLGDGLFEPAGLNSALRMAVAIGIPVGGAHSWDDWAKMYVAPEVEHDAHVFDLEDQLKIEELVGYKFGNRKLLMQAFTHASMVNTNSPCYQRLEFLGDAVLELTVVKHLYKKYPQHDPHHLTNLKCAIITNHFLSNLCVKIGLHRFIRYFSISLPAAISNYVTCLEDRKLTKGQNEFWLELEAPKVLSDIVEATMGAMFLDSGFDMSVIDTFFERHFAEFFDTDDPPTIQRHPMVYPQRSKLTQSVLCEYLQLSGCSDWEFKDEQEGDDPAASAEIYEASSQVTCLATFRIHDMDVETCKGQTRRLARLFLAENVNKALRENPRFIKDVCTCEPMSKKPRREDIEEWFGDY